MAADARQRTAVKPCLSERESFFGGAVSTREASAARRWDTLFDEPPPEPSVAVSRAAAGGKGRCANGGQFNASVAAPAVVFRDEEAEKKRKRAAQLADFDMLGSEQLAAAQPKLKAHKAGASQAHVNGGRSVPAASREQPRQSAPMPSPAARQARLDSSGRGGPVSSASVNRGSPAGIGRTSSPTARPPPYRATGVATSPLGASRRITGGSGSNSIRGGVSKLGTPKARVHTTKGGRKAIASRASAVAIRPSGNTGKQKATAAWTAAVAKMLPPPGSRKSNAVAQQQEQQQQRQQQQPQSSKLLAGLSMQSRGAASSTAKGVSRPAQQPGSRPGIAPRPSSAAAAAAGRSRGRGAPAQLSAAMGRGRGAPAGNRQLPAGRGRGAGGMPVARRIQGAASFYPDGGGSGGERVRGPTAASQSAQRAFRDYGDDTFEDDLIDDGGDVDSELEDDVEEEEGDWRAELRAITGYDPAKFAGERGDDRNMEVRNWGAVQAEERRSAREGAREDAEAEREELARLAKKKQAKLAARRKASS